MTGSSAGFSSDLVSSAGASLAGAGVGSASFSASAFAASSAGFSASAFAASSAGFSASAFTASSAAFFASSAAASLSCAFFFGFALLGLFRCAGLGIMFASPKNLAIRSDGLAPFSNQYLIRSTSKFAC